MHSSRKLKQVRHIWFSVVSSCLTGCALSDSSVFHEVLVFMWLWMRTNYCQQIWSLSLKPESHTVQAVRATCVLFAWGSLSVLPFSPPSRLQIHLFTVSSSFLYTRSNGTDKSPPPNKMNIVVCKWPYSYWIWNDMSTSEICFWRWMNHCSCVILSCWMLNFPDYERLRIGGLIIAGLLVAGGLFVLLSKYT